MQIGAAIQAIIQKIRTQLGLAAKLNRRKSSRATVPQDNHLRCRLPAHLRGLREYRCYEGKWEFWGFALRRSPEGAKFDDDEVREALSVFLRLKNGLLPALAIHL